MNTPKQKVLVFTHDAGGSEIIAAYVKKNTDKKDFLVYTAGPGARVFLRECIPFKRAPLHKAEIGRIMKKYKNVDLVLLGTGWMTKIESQALDEAKKHTLKTAAYLESWAGYRERFGYPNVGWQKNLPDEIWLGDKYAIALAKKNFPKTRLCYVPNQYFRTIVERYKSYRSRGSNPSSILFLSNAASGEENVFRSICKYLAEQKKIPILRIRFHPADNRARYDEIIQEFKDFIRFEKSTEKDIVRDLLRARVVIGTETVAMAVSSLSGIKTISITPHGKKPKLPFGEIIHVHRAKDIANLI